MVTELGRTPVEGAEVLRLEVPGVGVVRSGRVCEDIGLTMVDVPPTEDGTTDPAIVETGVLTVCPAVSAMLSLAAFGAPANRCVDVEVTVLGAEL